MQQTAPDPQQHAHAAPSYQPLVIVLAAVCVGILLDRKTGISTAAWLLTAAVAWGIWLILWRTRLDRYSGAVLLAALAAAGAAWHHIRWSLFDRDDLGWYALEDSGPVCVEAVALTGPRRVPAPPSDPMRPVPVGDRTDLDVRIERLRQGAKWFPVAGRAGLTADGHLLAIRAGDRLRIFAQLNRPSPVRNPGGFDHLAQRRADRQLSSLWASYPDCVTIFGQGRPAAPLRWIEDARAAGDNLLWRYLDHRRAGLAAAVLLGAREEIDPDRSEKFTETGSVHLLAISGLHVGIVALVLTGLLRLTPVSRRTALWIVVLAVVAYTLLTGARPPAVRATILVAAFCAAQSMGRRSLPFNALAAAGLVVLALNPADLFRTGVQLSFVAVAGLMWLSPAWFGGRSGLPGWQGLVAKSRGWFLRGLWAFWWTARHLTLVSATIWLLTLPLVMARFHLFTPAALLLNTVVWIPMTVALGAGLGVLVFGWLLPPVAALFARCCDGALWLLEGCVNQAHGVPGSHFWVPGPADWWLAGFYAGLAVLALGASIGLPRRWSVAILAGWIAVGFAWPTAREEGPRLDCTFLSVGHGAAVVLELPSGQTVLYDAGQFSSPRSGARTIAAFLWSRGITRVDTVILSHPDLDHYNALPELLDRLGVREIRVPAGMFDQESWALAALLQAVQRSGTPIREISQGARVDAGADCRIDVLHPPQGGTVGADNAGSVTLAVDYYGRRILLPGDLEGSGLSELIAQSPWDCDVLLAPHHGSRGSNPPGLAAWCTPEVVVVSGSDEQDLEETVSAYRAAGASVFHTGRVGAVHVGIEKGRIAVAGFLEAKD